MRTDNDNDDGDGGNDDFIIILFSNKSKGYHQ